MAVSACSSKPQASFELIGCDGYSEKIEKERFRKLFPEYVSAQEKSYFPKEDTISDECLFKESIQVLSSIGNGSQMPISTSLLSLIELEVLRDKLCAREWFISDAHLRHACFLTFGWNPARRCSIDKNSPCSEEKISLYTDEKWFVQGLVYVAAMIEKKRGARDWKKWLVGKEEDWIREYSCYREKDSVRNLVEALLRGNFFTILKEFLVPREDDDPKNPKLQNFSLDFTVCREFFRQKGLESIAFRAICKTYPCTIVVHDCDLRDFFDFFEENKKRLFQLFYAFEYRGKTKKNPPFRIYKNEEIGEQIKHFLEVLGQNK